MAQRVKNLPTVIETWVQSLGQEDLLEKDMETHSTILAWKIPWREEPGKLQFMGLQRVRLNWSDCKCWWRSRATEIIINVYRDTKWCILFGECNLVVFHGEGNDTPLLPGKSHWWRGLVGCSPWGHEESDTTEWLQFHFSLSCIREGNGNPLQCSCQKNPRDEGAWWASVYGVPQIRTRLKWLSSSSSSSMSFNIDLL